MEEKIKKEYVWRTKKLLEKKQYIENLIKGINISAVHFIRYSEPFLKWTREELKQMDHRTRKLMTMHKALPPRDDADTFYVSRKDGGRALAGIEDSVAASIQQHEDYMQKRGGRLITATKTILTT